MPEQLIEITTIQRLCLHDGPGVRTTIFLKGCYLDCPWCCNPETKSDKAEYYYYPEKCWYNKVGNILPEICSECKNTLNSNCPYGVYEAISTKWDVDALFSKVFRDKDFWGEEGGVTLSGGEPLMQAEALLPFMRKLKENGIHIAMETSLYAPNKNLKVVEPYVDMFIVDIKILQKPYVARRYKDETLDFFDNIQYLSLVNKINTLRMVLIDNVTATEGNIEELKRLTSEIKFFNLEFLEYHTLGNKKAERAGLAVHQFQKPNREVVAILTAKFDKAKYLKL